MNTNKTASIEAVSETFGYYRGRIDTRSANLQTDLVSIVWIQEEIAAQVGYKNKSDISRKLQNGNFAKMHTSLDDWVSRLIGWIDTKYAKWRIF